MYSYIKFLADLIHDLTRFTCKKKAQIDFQFNFRSAEINIPFWDFSESIKYVYLYVFWEKE